MATHQQGPTIGGFVRNAVPKTYNGRRYASTMEARYAERLDRDKRAEIVTDWKPQVRLPLASTGPDGISRKIGVYIADFAIWYADGTREILETKGHWTDVAKFKRRVFEATWLPANPGWTFRVVTKVDTFGAAEDEQPRARGPRQRTMTAEAFRLMHGRGRRG